jgi:hypothetical protein
MTGPRRLAALLTLAVVAAGAGCRDVNVVTHTYATLEEARRGGAVSGGYLPEGLPSGTFDIREAHDPGTDRRWALFSFPVAQADAVRALLQPNPTDVDGLMMEVPGRVEWWPVILRQRLDGAAIGATGLETYRTRPGGDLMAINWRQGRAYLWNADQ